MKRARSGSDSAGVLARVCAALERDPAGMHQLEKPCPVLDTALPAALAETYRSFDGAELYQGMLIIRPSRELELEDGRYAVGEVGGDDLFVDPADGSVWRLEKDSGDLLPEGSAFDRWLWGAVEAEGQMYDEDGEYLDDLFDDSGELTPETAVRRERSILERDRSAVAPRWRLARALGRLGRVEDARRVLEEAVELAPTFAWGWFDLARSSERAGQLDGAIDEAREAADVAADAEPRLAGFFAAHAARLAGRVGDEGAREVAARRALALDPELLPRLVSGARERVESSDEKGARELLELVLAIEPDHIEARELLGVFATRQER